MDCPRCNVEMAELGGDDATLKKCSECGGLWIDVAELNRVLLHNNMRGLEGLGGKVNLDELPGQCPECHVDLMTIEGGDRQHPLKYDTCESCGGIFVESEFKDATELQAALDELVGFFRRFAGQKSSRSAAL